VVTPDAISCDARSASTCAISASNCEAEPWRCVIRSSWPLQSARPRGARTHGQGDAVYGGQEGDGGTAAPPVWIMLRCGEADREHVPLLRLPSIIVNIRYRVRK
jgi:hypothetical protein